MSFETFEQTQRGAQNHSEAQNKGALVKGSRQSKMRTSSFVANRTKLKATLSQ